MPIDSVDQSEVVIRIAPIWTEIHETAKRSAQRSKMALDVVRAKGVRFGENPVTVIKNVQALSKAKIKHHKASPRKARE